MSQGSQALAAHLDLIEWIGKYGGEWAKWMHDAFAPEVQAMTTIESVLWPFDALGQADTVFVSREMCAVIEKAADEMPEVPIQPENLLWPSAFILFERPIEHRYAVAEGEDVLKTSALYFTNAHDKLAKAERIIEGEVEIHPGIVHVTFVHPSQVDSEIGFSDIRTNLFPFDFSGWAFGKNWKVVPDGEQKWGESIDGSLAQQRKLLLAVNLIAAQYISLVAKVRGQRQQRRRAEKVMPEYGDVSYITLRRANGNGSSEGGEGIEYSHRFVVSGHWRHQWYPSRQEHELRWIDPYVKGPEDRPLVIKDRVYKVVR